MAKMFYTLEETAGKLGVSEQEVKDMAASGRLQQFRDRDKLMFKRDQVDAMGGAEAGASGTSIPLADSGDTDAIDLSGETDVAGGSSINESTGVSVFDAGEIEPADPQAQTQVTSPVIDDEELALESVGSGSGLLDLTRESDDTSLGAELLDEIYPGGDSTAGSISGSAVGSSGVFEGGLTATGTAAPSGLENLEGAVSTTQTPSTGPATIAYDDGGYDGAGSGLSAGLLIASAVALVIALIVAASAMGDIRSGLTAMMSENNTMYWAWIGGLAVVTVIFGVAGLFIGKAASR